MPRAGDTYVAPFPAVVTNTTIESAVRNGWDADLVNDLNTARPILSGGTGATNAAQARTNLQTEVSKALVTPNYAGMVWEPGSFYSPATTGLGAPVDGHAFAGICYMVDVNNIVLEARDLDDASVPGLKWVREKKAGVWGAWLTEGDDKVSVAGDTMTGTLTLAYSDPTINLTKPADANVCQMTMTTAGTARWLLRMSDAGASDFNLYRYNDAGVLQSGLGLGISRATGAVSMTGALTANSFTGSNATINSNTTTSTLNVTSVATLNQLAATTVTGMMTFNTGTFGFDLKAPDGSHKYFRTNSGSSGTLAVVNNANTTEIFTISDAGLVNAASSMNATKFISVENATCQFGGSASRGVFCDGSNMGVRSIGTFYFQNDGGSATWATLNGSAFTVNETLAVNAGISATLACTFYSSMLIGWNGVGVHNAVQIGAGNANGSGLGVTWDRTGGYWGQIMKDTLTGGTGRYIGFLRDDNATLGAIDGTGGGVAFSSISDADYKEDIRPVREVMDTKAALMALKVSHYKWRGLDKHDVGLLAQQVSETIPGIAIPPKETMKMNEDGTEAGTYLSPWMINYGGAVPYVIDVVQMQQDEIDALTGEVANGKDTINKLVARIEALERKMKQ